MPLTKPKETEALKVYHQYWDSYFNRDVTTFGTTLDEAYEMIGTSSSEICHNKADGIAFLQAQITEVVGKVEMRNRTISSKQVNNMFLILENCDIYVAGEPEWNFYSKLRLSTLLHETASGWKVLQQHGSIPDGKVQEGETLAFQKISKENLELRDAVKRRTAELENNNRELEIEAALERVRGLTMAMHSSEDVGKCIIKMFSELTALGVDEGTRFGIGILNHDNENNQLWTARKNGDEVNMHIGNIDMASHPLLKSARKAWKAQIPFHKYVLEGEDLLNYYRMLNNAPDYKIQIPLEKLPKKEIQHCFIFEHGFFYAFSPREFQPDLIHITKRFSSLFEQTYRRYLDLVKAESQALEAQIEAALERVRSCSLAMHKSEELHKVIFVVAEQIAGLDIYYDSVHFLDIQEDGGLEMWVATLSQHYAPKIFVPYLNHPFFNQLIKAKKEGIELHSRVLDFEEKNSFFHHFYKNTIAKSTPDERKQFVFQSKGLAWSSFPANSLSLLIANYQARPYSDQENEVFKRFANVFEQAYTRFLDLQKAEAQAREAQIEAALERVRSRTMAMHHTEELKEVIQVVFDQFVGLNINVEHAGFILDYKEREDMHIWLADHQQGVPTEITIPYFESPHWNSYLEAKAKHKSFFANVLSFEVKNKFYRDLFEWIPTLTEEAQQAIFSKPGLCISTVLLDNVGLYIEHYSETPFSAEENAVLMRFGKVFQQTYTRFLDLQKAEAQAREAKIETALEKVRSRTMGMQSSSELPEVANLLFLEVQALGIPAWSCGYCILLEDRRSSTCIMSSEGILQTPFQLRLWGENSFDEMGEFVLSEDTMLVQELGGEALEEHYAYMKSFPDLKPTFDEIDRLGLSLPTYQINHLCKFTQGFILFITYEKVLDSHDIFKRFTNVFDQTYTRFLDLKQAEKQAREAQIEAALERVRSRSLAMHKSEELADLSMELVKQVQTLGMESWFCAFNIYDDDPRGSVEWGSNGQGTFPTYRTPREGVFLRYFEAGQRGETLLVNEIGEEECPAHYEYLCSLPGVGEQLLQMKAAGIPFPTSQIDHVAFFKYGYVLFITFEPAPESHDIFKRFAHVFEQSYTRFLDLQKAEVQAREALIEAALERVRSKTMSMHNSKDVGQTISLMFDELLKLGVEKSIRCGIGILHATNPMELWTASTDKDEKIVLDIGFLDMNLHPLLVGAKAAWQARKKQFTYELNGIDLKNYFRAINNAPEYSLQVDLETLPPSIIHNDFFFTEGMLFTFSPSPISDELEKVFKRFAAVFGQTYRRYLDLQNAELQAKEAIKRASLDRVRGEIASMRSTADLDRITPLIWQELTNLSIPFIRCGVFIMNETNEIIDAHLASPEGQSLGILQLRFSDSETTKESVIHWRQQKLYTQHWNKAEFVQWTQTLIEKGQVENPQSYQGSVMPPESLHLHFVPFNQGMLYVGNTHALINEELTAVQSLAEAFSIAFARYEDFKTLEIAKQNIENTLSELKATQSQLIQSEKLASLGQLTAGIAHEIKNPLNFVNNFSDLSMELIDEVFEVLYDSNNPESSEDIRELLTVVKSNLEKIYLHGTRADGIVKSMLQHSRGGSGIPEPTDLNGLVKEYVNLAFHGMRAGKNPINVTIDLQLDPKISTVPLIAEDFSRVILNLCNNAFDACAERSRSTKREKVLRSKDRGTKTEEEESVNVEYNAKLKVTTSLENKCIRISCEDNGPGIPDEIKDKILQPFFTTKKGTEGTGLGLSITNDIIKAHGGSLEVHTEVGKGTTFTIILTIAN